eukprot:TRINITY_DN1415_c0_g3_i1.p1 TRINITY_DN1415_c0_g3~~TRINITY_DN1415_c0_g3_i1.p1  ORF type:complete len:397 (+),score=52.85 TRINITY_DN1415_c0_g3_i1:15-1205(+)
MAGLEADAAQLLIELAQVHPVQTVQPLPAPVVAVKEEFPPYPPPLLQAAPIRNPLALPPRPPNPSLLQRQQQLNNSLPPRADSPEDEDKLKRARASRSPSPEAATAAKRRRISIVCTECRRVRVACTIERPCPRCRHHRLECVDAPSNKRGPKPGRRVKDPLVQQAEDGTIQAGFIPMATMPFATAPVLLRPAITASVLEVRLEERPHKQPKQTSKQPSNPRLGRSENPQAEVGVSTPIAPATAPAVPAPAPAAAAAAAPPTRRSARRPRPVDWKDYECEDIPSILDESRIPSGPPPAIPPVPATPRRSNSYQWPSDYSPGNRITPSHVEETIPIRVPSVRVSNESTAIHPIQPPTPILVAASPFHLPGHDTDSLFQAVRPHETPPNIKQENSQPS